MLYYLATCSCCSSKLPAATCSDLLAAAGFSTLLTATCCSILELHVAAVILSYLLYCSFCLPVANWSTFQSANRCSYEIYLLLAVVCQLCRRSAQMWGVGNEMLACFRTNEILQHSSSYCFCFKKYDLSLWKTLMKYILCEAYCYKMNTAEVLNFNFDFCSSILYKKNVAQCLKSNYRCVSYRLLKC
jgi:hypothetical protein